MAKINKEELGKLSAAERIKRLKSLEEENKKEIEEAEKLIHETESQIERDGIAESVKVPETKPIDISSLFAEEQNLEATVKKEATEEDQGPLYELAQDYEAAKGIAYGGESPSEDQMGWIDQLGERVEKIKYHGTSDEIANLVVATKSLIHKIKKYQMQ